MQIRERLGIDDPRLASLVALNALIEARQSGQTMALLERVKRHARETAATMQIQVRDRVGFAPRTDMSAEISAYLVDDLEDFLKKRVLVEVARVIRNDYRQEREGRYATVARMFVASGSSKKQTASTLGFSTSVLDRILIENPRDVELP